MTDTGTPTERKPGTDWRDALRIVVCVVAFIAGAWLIGDALNTAITVGGHLSVDELVVGAVLVWAGAANIGHRP